MSGILVAVCPEQLDRCVRALEALPGVEAHQVDRPGGRVVVTYEAEGLQAHESGLRAIQAVPDVLFAELVYHYTGDEPVPDPVPGGPASGAGRPTESDAGS